MSCMPGKEDAVDAILAIEIGIYINYLAIATGWGASVIRQVGKFIVTYLKEG